MRRRLMLAALFAPGLAACEGAAPNGGAGQAQGRSFNLFFTADSAALDEAARQVVASAAALAMANPTDSVRVLGFAAPDAGSAPFNRSLALARAQAVQDALAEAGVPRARIRVESRGATPFEMFPTESRRVEIRFGR